MYAKLPFLSLLLVSMAACTSNDPGTSNNGTSLDGGTQDAASDTSLPPGCTNATQDGTETDVDCGGSTCPACVETLRCITGADCESTVCRVGKCAAATCNDNVLNQDESDSDCGGTTCSGCGNGRACGEHNDCLSGFCNASGACANSCPDGEVNGSETDVDCGGSGCPGCADGKACSIDSDCVDMACSPSGICVAHCTSMSKDSNETDEDCGGPDCDPCPDLDACLIPSDCQSGVCTSNICQVPTCTDSVHNGTETDVDCGGPCSPCVDGQMCSAGSDCTSMVCDMGTCGAAGCTDMVKNGTETDIDCGGTGCSPCDPGDMCLLPSDCTSSKCTSNICDVPTCSDGVLNQDESDVDCGGVCNACPDLDMCNNPSDCESGVCTSNTCQVPTCTDNVHNGSETDIDCGGTCDGCGSGSMCTGPSDCESGVCTGGVCQAPTCIDGVSNGRETDVDCGGPDCSSCLAGQTCGWSKDCASGSCAGHVCDPMTTYRSCRQAMEIGGHTTSGTYSIKPDPASSAVDVFCDMETDGGGWTTVAKTVRWAPVDRAWQYYSGLDVFDPTDGPTGSGVWGGMRNVIQDKGDIRFACVHYDSAFVTGSTLTLSDLDVDFSVYDNDWYRRITNSTSDSGNDLVDIVGNNLTPARRNNVNNVYRWRGNTWNASPHSSGGPKIEDTAGDSNDFYLDFDDVGIGGTYDGTEWGERDGYQECIGLGTNGTRYHGAYYIFVREKPLDILCNINGAKDISETDVDCGGGNCLGCKETMNCIHNGDCQSLSCVGGTCAQTNYQSCKAIHDMQPWAPTGTYEIRPGGTGTGRSVYCDMDTDGGGWTAVVSAAGGAPDDLAVTYHPGLAHLETPTEVLSPYNNDMEGFWSGMRSAISGNSDIRFACRRVGEPFSVDMSFYDVDWYREITQGTDTQSCMVAPSVRSGNIPARKNNVTGQILPLGDTWNNANSSTGGGPSMEYNCSDPVVFTITFDGIPNSTTWGRTRNIGTRYRSYCVDWLDSGADFYAFVREP